MAPDTGGDDAPNFAAVIADRERWIVLVLSREMPLSSYLLQAFDGEIAVQDGNDDVVGLRGDTAIHHKEVAIEDPGTAHGFSRSAHEECGGRPADQMFVEVESALDVIVRRAGEARRHLRTEQREVEFGRGINEAQHENMVQTRREHKKNKCAVIRQLAHAD